MVKPASGPQIVVVGLRSGGVLTVTKDGQEDVIDVSQVQLWDVAYGIAGENRFTGQLYRNPYTVAEHTVLGSYLFPEYPTALRWMFHDTGEGFGVGDIHSGVKGAYAGRLRTMERRLTVALAKKFLGDHADPLSPEIEETDKALGQAEIAYLHPAKDKLLAMSGKTKADVLEQFSKAERTVINGWFGRPIMQIDEAANMWMDRLGELKKLIGDTAQVQVEVSKQLAVPAFLPYPENFLEAALVSKLQVRRELVAKEIGRLEARGVLVRRGGYYHQGEK